METIEIDAEKIVTRIDEILDEVSVLLAEAGGLRFALECKKQVTSLSESPLRLDKKPSSNDIRQVILDKVYHNPEFSFTIADLAEECETDRYTVMRAVDRLNSHNVMLTRTPDSKDRKPGESFVYHATKELI